MYRKVLQHGKSTLSVSLPHKWTDKFNITKGDELTIHEKGNSLIISTEKHYSRGKKQIQLSQYPHLMHRALAALYTCGYEEIEVPLADSSERQRVQELIQKEFLGLEVTEATQSTVRIQVVSHFNPEEFPTFCKKLLQKVLQLSNEIIEAFKKGEHPDLEQINALDLESRNLSDVCRRTLHLREDIAPRPYPQYYLLSKLKMISTSYQRIAASSRDIPTDEQDMERLAEIHTVLEAIFRNYTRFKLSDLDELRRISKQRWQTNCSQSRICPTELHVLRQHVAESINSLLEIHL